MKDNLFQTKYDFGLNKAFIESLEFFWFIIKLK